MRLLLVIVEVTAPAASCECSQGSWPVVLSCTVLGFGESWAAGWRRRGATLVAVAACKRQCALNLLLEVRGVGSSKYHPGEPSRQQHKHLITVNGMSVSRHPHL